MKLVIQIPCYNEEATLPLTLADLPTRIDGIDEIVVQVIDDGSTDGTLETARKAGIREIVSFKRNRGLAAAFKAGVDNALALRADILVNTDGDNQYRGGDIPSLIRPILSAEADMVVGCRPIADHPEFSSAKKLVQRFGSWVLRQLSNTGVRDAASGFRAYNREALLSLNCYSRFSYTMETLIHAGLGDLQVVGVDVGVNAKTRESRLFRSTFQFVWKQAKTIIGIFILYRANWLFNTLASAALFGSLLLLARYVALTVLAGAPASSFWPSIIFSAVLLAISFQLFLTGILASLISSGRTLAEDTGRRVKKLEMSAARDEKG